MPYRNTALLWMALAATLMGCAHNSPRPTPPPQPPVIPQPPSVSSPPPEGTYWKKHCDFRQSLQQRLKITLQPSEHCSGHGPGSPASDDDRR